MFLFEKNGFQLEDAVVSYFKVRYGETDQMKNVYYGRYFEWFEVARVDWIKSKGLTYRELEEMSCFLPVIEVSVRYLASNQYDDDVCIYTWLKRSTYRSVEYLHMVKNVIKDRFTTEAEVRLMAVDANGRPTRMPEKYFNSFQTKKIP